MLVALIARDKPDSLGLRLANRAAHLDYIAKTGVATLAGPLIEDGNPVGSLILLNVADMPAAQVWADKDPYAKAGLFESVQLTEWKKVVG
ncbi:YciI family protein [Pukyongiella litopenaei]|uniref:YciI family protein n=1 Tax=Pukyongiella litopenaei TaxID=2605946 RepID=A0A2S0MMS7_9RHOB|nr:YciI family protein [Pukyongiella litopenaei]AVO37188.1 YciI family protein [Pukyongiella litopenaei]